MKAHLHLVAALTCLAIYSPASAADDATATGGSSKDLLSSPNGPKKAKRDDVQMLSSPEAKKNAKKAKRDDVQMLSSPEAKKNAKRDDVQMLSSPEAKKNAKKAKRDDVQMLSSPEAKKNAKPSQQSDTGVVPDINKEQEGVK